jgi:hypothetical protein
MENTINTGAIQATLDQTTKSSGKPNPFVLALVFTTILCFAVRPSITKNTQVVVASDSSETIVLSETVADAVVDDLSQRSGLPKSELKIVDAQQLIVSDRCSSTDNSKLLCNEPQISGWQITVASRKKRWIYRTNNSGSLLKLDNHNITPKYRSQGSVFASNSSSISNG